MNNIDRITANDDNSARRQYDLGFHDGRAATLRQRQKRKPAAKKKTSAKRTTTKFSISFPEILIGFVLAVIISNIIGC